MASSSIVNPWVGITVTEKLSRTNHAMRRAQILAAVRGFRLEGHLTGAIQRLQQKLMARTPPGRTSRLQTRSTQNGTRGTNRSSASFSGRWLEKFSPRSPQRRRRLLSGRRSRTCSRRKIGHGQSIHAWHLRPPGRAT
jgi:hypothetical protein